MKMTHLVDAVMNRRGAPPMQKASSAHSIGVSLSFNRSLTFYSKNDEKRKELPYVIRGTRAMIGEIFDSLEYVYPRSFVR